MRADSRGAPAVSAPGGLTRRRSGPLGAFASAVAPSWSFAAALAQRATPVPAGGRRAVGAPLAFGCLWLALLPGRDLVPKAMAAKALAEGDDGFAAGDGGSQSRPLYA